MRSRLDPQLEMFTETVLDFASKELADAKQDNDRCPAPAPFSEALAKAMAVGFFSATLPEELGGSEMGTAELCLLLENLSSTDASLAAVIFTDTLAKDIVYRARGFVILDELRQRVGELGASLFAFPSHAAPAECVTLSARADGGDSYLLDGVAPYVVLGGLAGHAVLPAATDGPEYSFFLVNLAGRGVECSEPVQSLGLRACPAADLELDGAPGTLIGSEGEGPVYFQRVEGMLNAAAAAMSLGVMKGSFEEAVDYAREREQGGRVIVNWSEVRRILARMAVKVKSCDLMLSEVCFTAGENPPGWKTGAQAAALACGQAAVEVTTDGIQVLGGNGYMEDYGQEKRFRDASQIRSLMGHAPMRELRLMEGVLAGESLLR